MTDISVPTFLPRAPWVYSRLMSQTPSFHQPASDAEIFTQTGSLSFGFTIGKRPARSS